MSGFSWRGQTWTVLRDKAGNPVVRCKEAYGNRAVPAKTLLKSHVPPTLKVLIAKTIKAV